LRRPPLLRAPGCNEALIDRVETASGGRHRFQVTGDRLRVTGYGLRTLERRVLTLSNRL
jgi:hypothetical protein